MKPLFLPTVPALRMKLLAAFGTAMLVLVVAAIGIGALDRQQEAQERVHQSIDVRSRVRNILELVHEAHMAQATYLVVGDTELLTGVRNLRIKLEAELVGLRASTNDPSQLARISEIAPELRAQASAFEESLQLIDSRDRETVRDFVRNNKARFDYAPLARSIDAVRIAENVIISERKVVSSDRLVSTRILIITGSAIAFLLATFVISRIRRSVIELEKAHDTIAAQANEIGQRSRELERTVRDLDQFAYVASHDLKAPLRGITTLAQWIQEDSGDKLDDQGREHLRLMQVRVARMEALVEGVLAYARAGRAAVPNERIDGNALVREAIDLLAQHPNGGKVIIDNTLPTIYGVKIAFQQIWLNLVSNALKYGAQVDGVVHVGSTREDGEPVYYVSDNGPGIEPQFHEKIFGLFQTLSARDKVESTGIGLAVVKKLVDHHGGRVWLTSEIGKGTTFRFTFPTAPEPVAQGASEAGPKRKRRGPTATAPGL